MPKILSKKKTLKQLEKQELDTLLTLDGACGEIAGVLGEDWGDLFYEVLDRYIENVRACNCPDRLLAVMNAARKRSYEI
jgi:hypothetical protein